MPAGFCSLSSELIAHIFSFLDCFEVYPCLTLSKRIHPVAREALPQTVALQNWTRLAQFSLWATRQAGLGCLKCKRLAFKDLEDGPVICIPMVLNAMSGLVSLKVEFAPITFKREFLDSVKRLDNLRELMLAHPNDQHLADGFNWSDVHEVLSAVPALTAITLDFIQGDFINFEERSWPSVQQMRITYGSLLRPEDCSNLLLAPSRPLRVLELRYIPWPQELQRALSVHAGTLQDFLCELLPGVVVEEEERSSYLQECTQLQDITLHYTAFNDETLWHLPAALQKLTIFGLQDPMNDFERFIHALVISLVAFMGKNFARRTGLQHASVQEPALELFPKGLLPLRRVEQLQVRLLHSSSRRADLVPGSREIIWVQGGLLAEARVGWRIRAGKHWSSDHEGVSLGKFVLSTT
jgi:hypothetical protein